MTPSSQTLLQTQKPMESKDATSVKRGQAPYKDAAQFVFDYFEKDAKDVFCKPEMTIPGLVKLSSYNVKRPLKRILESAGYTLHEVTKKGWFASLRDYDLRKDLDPNKELEYIMAVRVYDNSPCYYYYVKDRCRKLAKYIAAHFSHNLRRHEYNFDLNVPSQFLTAIAEQKGDAARFIHDYYAFSIGEFAFDVVTPIAGKPGLIGLLIHTFYYGSEQINHIKNAYFSSRMWLNLDEQNIFQTCYPQKDLYPRVSCLYSSDGDDTYLFLIKDNCQRYAEYLVHHGLTPRLNPQGYDFKKIASPSTAASITTEAKALAPGHLDSQISATSGTKSLAQFARGAVCSTMTQNDLGDWDDDPIRVAQALADANAKEKFETEKKKDKAAESASAGHTASGTGVRAWTMTNLPVPTA